MPCSSVFDYLLFIYDSILWWPLGKHDKLVSIDEGNLFLWSIDSSTKAAKVLPYSNTLNDPQLSQPL